MNPKKVSMGLTFLLFSTLIGFVMIYYFGQRDLVFLIDLTRTDTDAHANVNGLETRHTLASGRTGEVFVIEEHVMTEDEVEIELLAPPNLSEFSRLVVEATFTNPDNPTLEACTRVQEDIIRNTPTHSWECHYLDHRYLDRYKTFLGEEWQHLSDKERGLTLFQKPDGQVYDEIYEKVLGQGWDRFPKNEGSEPETLDYFREKYRYTSVEEFLADPPSKNLVREKEIDANGQWQIVSREQTQIATLDYTLPHRYSPEAGIDRDATSGVAIGHTDIPYTFRGSLQMFVLVTPDSGNLTLEFLKQDRNAYSGEDEYEVRIYDTRGRLVHYEILADDRITDASQRISLVEHKIVLENIPAGGYFIDFDYAAPDNDSFLRSFSVNSDLVLINDFIVADRDSYLAQNLITKPMELFGSPGKITLQPGHRITSQEVLINDIPHFTEHGNEPTYVAFLNRDINRIVTTENDLSIKHSDNYLALEPKDLIDVFPQKTRDFDIKALEGINYILANYIPESAEEKQAQVVFDIDRLDRDSPSIRLKLKADSLSGYGNSISLDHLEIRLER